MAARYYGWRHMQDHMHGWMNAVSHAGSHAWLDDSSVACMADLLQHGFVHRPCFLLSTHKHTWSTICCIINAMAG
eukprot:1145361-Pelagomonas_calceolata.AAC.3